MRTATSVRPAWSQSARVPTGMRVTRGALRRWLNRVGAKTLHIEPGSTWANGCVVSFNGKLPDEQLYSELIGTLRPAKAVIEA